MDLKNLITRQNLNRLAGSRSFSRGEKYFEIGLVGPINEKNGMVSAKIHGSAFSKYRRPPDIMLSWQLYTVDCKELTVPYYIRTVDKRPQVMYLYNYFYAM